MRMLRRLDGPAATTAAYLALLVFVCARWAA